MPEPKSPHLPEMAGGVATITGEGIVDTTLRNIRTVQLTFNVSNFTPDEEARVSWYRQTPTSSKIVIRTEKGGANDGLVGTNPVDIAWLALGD